MKTQLYTKMKVFHYKDKLDSLPASTGVVLPPLHIRIKPTNVCNHRCHYCAYRTDHLQLGADMDPRDVIPRDKMMEIVDDLAAMKVQAVTFSGGGEPFCYPYLGETVQRLAATGIRFAALTNGARVEGGVAEVFAHHGTWLRVSMDGWDDESYSRYRGVPEGEFTKVLRNLRQFKAFRGTCFLGVSLIVDQQNAEHIYDFLSAMKDIGIDSAKISPCIIDNDGAINNQYHRSIFKKAKEQIAYAQQKLADDRFEIFDAYHELDDKFGKDYTWCPYLQILPVIGADLRVYSCQDKAYNLSEGQLGSIQHIRFRDFWHQGKEKFFRINPSVHCNHHCVANHKNRLVWEYLYADPEHCAFV